jgi:hypothetical protein
MKKNERSKSKEKNLIPFEGLTFMIEGLALIYKKGAFYKMRLPYLDDHILKVVITSTVLGTVDQKVSEILVPVGGSVEITNMNSSSPTGTNFTKVFNIATLHRPYPLKFISKVDDVSVSFSIDEAVRFTPSDKPEHRHNFETWEVLFSGESNERRQKLADSQGIISAIKGLVRFVDPKTAATKINIVGIGNTPFEILLNYNDGLRQEIIISNLCDKNDQICLNKSDFPKYYTLLQNNLGDIQYDFVMKEPLGSRAPCNVVYSDTDPE